MTGFFVKQAGGDARRILVRQHDFPEPAIPGEPYDLPAECGPDCIRFITGATLDRCCTQVIDITNKKKMTGYDFTLFDQRT
jgi:hypothetical protein